MTDFEADVEAIAYAVAGGLVGLDETTFERKVQDLAGEGVPVVNAKFDGAVAGVTTRLAAFDALVH